MMRLSWLMLGILLFTAPQSDAYENKELSFTPLDAEESAELNQVINESMRIIFQTEIGKEITEKILHCNI